jgi:pilus assembly protein Flp/PilA
MHCGIAQCELQHAGEDVNMKNLLSGLHQDDSGQDLIEYALVAALIAFAAVTAMNGLAASINSTFSVIGSKLTSALA